jgi:glycosyltransferase involved in cell wall biosynthesis
MKIVFVGSVYPLEREEEIRRNSRAGIDNAANNLQWALLTGLDHFYPDTEVLTQPCIGTFPLKYRRVLFKGSGFSHKPGARDHCLGFINLPLVKHLVKEIELFKILKKNTGHLKETTIIIYGVHSPYLKAVTQLKGKHKNIKICQIVPDLPQFMSESRNPIYRLLKCFDAILINNYLKKVDSFVLLSDHMAPALNVGNRPWTRVEGIFEQKHVTEHAEKENYKTILYTGTLAQRYGIINLLDAFDAIKNPDYRLWICGEGKCRGEIQKRAGSDRRIKYFGQQTRASVSVLQKRATVLVNPRTPEKDYTKYSFPSKTMEYLASGTPCIIYGLEGIPEEYFHYCFVINNENRDGLKEMIVNVCEKDPAELEALGKKAYEFILKNKNPISQVKKICDLIN